MRNQIVLVGVRLNKFFHNWPHLCSLQQSYIGPAVLFTTFPSSFNLKCTTKSKYRKVLKATHTYKRAIRKMTTFSVSSFSVYIQYIKCCMFAMQVDPDWHNECWVRLCRRQTAGNISQGKQIHLTNSREYCISQGKQIHMINSREYITR